MTRKWGLTAGNVETYRRFTRRILEGQDEPTAMATAIGAPSMEEFARIGKLEVDLLEQYGLKEDDFLIDVGCGSGRLASQLRDRHSGPYLGTDVSPEVIDYAARLTNRPQWRFLTVKGLEIPIDPASADMVCFFSVLTHLRHEESFLYLEEARRVLRVGGVIVLTFLDFSQPNHRVVFEAAVDALRHGDDLHVNQFLSKDALVVWADLLDLDITAMLDGQDCYIQVSEPNHESDVAGRATLGQSVCVLVKRRA